MNTTVNFQKQGGLVPVIVQDWSSSDVLMLAYVNAEALRKTQETGKAHYYSRSRKKLWMKGESSGHVQEVKDILIDCDEDTLIFKVNQIGGAACHTGYRSCFFRRVNTDDTLEELSVEKVFDPEKVYANK